MDDSRRTRQPNESVKIVSIIIILSLAQASVADEWHDKWSESGSTWHERWTNLANESDTMSPSEKCVILSRALGVGSKVNMTEEERTVYTRLQKMILDTPNHARYIADEVERTRQEEEHLPRRNQTSYDRVRRTIIAETLRYLPSPETIQVLGNYLDDERDPPPRLEFLPENSFLGSVALSEIGLRNPPVSARPGMHNWREELVKQKAWYAQVKAGTIPISFVGQKVEYWFKPDGTWETLAMENPPDDGPRPIKPINTNEQRATKKQNPALASHELKPPSDSFPWIVGVSIFLIAGTCWVALRKLPANSR